MKITKSTAHFALTSADPAKVLSILSSEGFSLYNTTLFDPLTVRFSAETQLQPQIFKLAERYGWSVQVIEQHGVRLFLRHMKCRMVAILGVLLLLAASIYLPTRILFVRVEGNQTIPQKWILEQASECGLTFGASRDSVRSQQLKDALLAQMPQLQWVGVNTSGCVATITVRETSANTVPPEQGIRSVIAAVDGVITQITVTRGTARVRPGQSVQAGDVLISGYTDCGICILGEAAQGEVFAQTRHELQVVTPIEWQKEEGEHSQEKKISLIIGKKRINFYNSSGISGTTCDKMYVQTWLTLPGGFTLPVSVIVETWSYGHKHSADRDPGEFPREFAESYIRQSMTAGEITGSVISDCDRAGIRGILCTFACVEMIGRQRQEESILQNGKFN